MNTQATTLTTLDKTIDTVEPPADLEEDFLIYRVFFNQVDSFNAKYIAAFLTDQIYGASRAAKGEGEGEEGEEQEEEMKPPLVPGLAKKYEIIGTLRYPFHKPTEDILRVIDENDEDFLKQILKCGFVIYDITEDPDEIPKALQTLAAIEKEIESVKDIGPKTFARWDEQRTFILLSTVMTWAKSKPVDPEDPDVGFTEADYKRRKNHPNYQAHKDCEKEVILKGRKYKNKLKTYVIGSGIPYGQEEDDLDFLFKLAWKNEKELPIFGKGKNTVPLIHVEDLAKVIHGVCENTPSKPQYILAVEQTPTTLKQIVTALSKFLGTGKTKEVAQEEAFLLKYIDQAKFDKCTVNLNMEPGYITDELELEWKNDLNLAENMKAIVDEFRKSRNLFPIRIVVHGPPASGKTTLAKTLSEYYGSHYISVKSAIDETIADLRDRVDRQKEKQRLKQEKAKEGGEEAGEGEEEEEEEEEAEDIEELMEQIKEIEVGMEQSENGKLPDDQIIPIVRKILLLNACQNQGYVLDGFPKIIDQAKSVFGGGGGGEDEGEGGETKNILPDYVVSLKATDEFLCERIMKLPEAEIQGTHYTEENMIRRLDEFRLRNTEDNTVLNFFDEQEIPILVIDIMDEKYPDEEAIVSEVIKKAGPPRTFALLPDEEAELIALDQEKKRLEELERKLAEEMLQKQAVECYQNKMEQWTSLLEQLQLEEEKILVAECEPLRHYLIKYVLPTLTRGLIQVALIKPSDPIDFLAEFLFKENPEGRMFDPSYTRDAQRKLDVCTCIECGKDIDSDETPC